MLIITLATLAYTMLDKYVFAPDRKKGSSQSVFNNHDFVRPCDKNGRAPQSIFTKLIGQTVLGEVWADKSMVYAGYNDEVLHGYIDTGFDFNADSLFELFCYLNYWVSGAKAKELVFDRIMNPMFNMGLKTDTGTLTNNRFSSAECRFFWLYDDFLRLQALAEAPAGKYNIKVYTRNRKDAHTLDCKPYAAAILNILGQYPFICGFFIDGLSDPTQIMNREIQILTNIKVDNPDPPTSPATIPPNPLSINTPITGTQKMAAASFSILEKVGISIFASLILYLIFHIFKNTKKNG